MKDHPIQCENKGELFSAEKSQQMKWFDEGGLPVEKFQKMKWFAEPSQTVKWEYYTELVYMVKSAYHHEHLYKKQTNNLVSIFCASPIFDLGIYLYAI